MQNEKSPDASNENEVNAIKEKNKTKAEVFKDDMLWLMGNVRGRRIVWLYLVKCHIFESSFDTNLSKTNFNEGERNIGLQLFNDVMSNAEELYMKMAKENK